MPLPAPYAALCETLLGGPPPDEPLSACQACPCAGLTVNAASRCCDSEAELPNFQVGRGLDLPTVQTRLAARRGVSPLGMRRVRTGPCPHVSAEGCGVHALRPALCATWFCRTSRAETGQVAWRALGEWLRLLDGRLALWAVHEAGLRGDLLRSLLAPPDSRPSDTGPVDDATWAARFGPWAGREAELFAECTARVDSLSLDRALDIAGIEARVLAETAARTFAALGPGPLPGRLRFGRHQVVGLGPDAVRVVTTNVHQPLDVSAEVHGLLHHIDGRPTAEALAAMERERGAALDEATVRHLLDHRLLAESPEP